MLEETAVFYWLDVLFHRPGPRMPDSTHLWLIKLSVTEPGPGRPEKCCTLPLLSGPEADKQPSVPFPWHSAGLGKPPSDWLTDLRGEMPLCIELVRSHHSPYLSSLLQ